MPGRESRFTLRLYDAEPDLEFLAAVTGANRSEVIRRLVRREARRLEEETTPTPEEAAHAG